MPIQKFRKSSRGSYRPRKEEKYWGVFYLLKTDLTLREIAAIVEMKLPSVQTVKKRIQVYGNPLPRKSTGAPRKVDERTERHLERIVREDPFTSYNQLRKALSSMSINICRNMVIDYVKRLDFKSCISAHKSRLTEEQKKA
ncbi:Homeodomain-like DNA binding domain-containing transcription factor [Phycomyces blakesleeanus NRRL 1555(-)]|uniref:Homeodomain-like DNA binding domain-containing transcription factor n=1 Tax=Phycomyces blakesleeanus (strain ATCC 8743b / DSM 1359 / FGSC 10004 / NBRC 33097 / NRRL 1555) TaxID=763407 RepID=A0A163DL18_PHYB8|nr:Homeodomain-like DNA binding domain-containing transcription factor [Phycomyces blakesleeanus NRRL 1555(-)]OAD72040.1 Homeodomain-like DNA binding domain-containing transcription factor [Phycomyces blakesleeanus NRRL 1555(-)]|eukprot:XP_018290080.1 Homeodomain-like DNA binding domain-containing transcription factor [Phycomyces blakesleeanus NRRL 1555(-)]